MRRIVPCLLLTLAFFTVTMRAGTPSVHGHVLDPAALPLPGALVVLTAATGEPEQTITDASGEYAFDDVPPGRYTLGAELDGFTPSRRDNVDLSVDTLTVDLTLALAAIHQEVTVSAESEPDLIGAPQPNAPVSITRSVMDIAMMPNSQYDDVLALMPNVIRGPDGAMAIAGARPTSSGLFVNGIDVRNPIAGGAGLLLPLEAVDALHVYSAGAPAEFGGSTGGVTAVQTRAGGDAFHWKADSFFPRLLFGERGVAGVAFWDPDVGVSGPIVHGRTTFQQALSYRYDRNTFTTLSGPDHNVAKALLTWTQVDTQMTAGQRLRLSFAADPRDTDHAVVTAFTPSPSQPALEQGGWSSGASWAIASGRVATELQGSIARVDADVLPAGDDPYVVTHTATSGRYFDQQRRHSLRTSGTLRITTSIGLTQTLTAGASLARATLSQEVDARSILLLRSDGTAAASVAFGPAGRTDVGTNEVGLFVQDRWTPRSWLSIEGGIRRDVLSGASAGPLQPRIGWTLGSATGLTSLSGSAGIFSETLPLAAFAFGSLPARQISVQGPGPGELESFTLANAVDGRLAAARAARWDVEGQRRLGPWLLRVGYDERHGRAEPVVHPSLTLPGDGSSAGVARLASDGTSRSRSLEATAGFRTQGGDEGYVSYVRAATSGAQNTLDAVDGTLREAFLQADQTGPLPTDVPHRFLAWGVFHLPSHVTVAPFLDTRSGFPFTALNDAWMIVGAPNSQRLPWMTSLDLSATRVTHMPRHLPDARLGLKLYNLVGLHTEREVQRDVERTDFGQRYDPVPRDFAFVLELLWGGASGRSATRSGPR